MNVFDCIQKSVAREFPEAVVSFVSEHRHHTVVEVDISSCSVWDALEKKRLQDDIEDLIKQCSDFVIIQFVFDGE